MKVAQTLRKFNFRATPDSKLTLSPDDIPTLIPTEMMKSFMQGDTEPYFKIQEIEVPATGNHVIYPASFWNSYLGKLKNRPIPGSRNGHDMRYGVKPNTDLLLVGGQLIVNDKGVGKVYLKNYIPKVGDSGDNSFFILQNKAGMLDYSIVSYTKDEIETLPEGNMKITAVASIAGERNDAVEYGLGAMEQKTNASEPELEVMKELAMDLIAEGKVDRKSAWSPSEGDIELAPGYPIGREGIIFRSALRRQTARAAQDGFSEIAEAASALLKSVDSRSQTHIGRNEVDKEELLKKLNALKQNGEITLLEVATAMGLANQVVTDEIVQSHQRYNAIKQMVGEDPVEAVRKLQKRVADNEALERSNRLEHEFGPKVNSAGNKNLLREYAEKQLNSVALGNLDGAIAEFKKDDIAQRFAAENADNESEVNLIVGRSERRGNQTAQDDGIPTITIGGK